MSLLSGFRKRKHQKSSEGESGKSAPIISGLDGYWAAKHKTLYPGACAEDRALALGKALARYFQSDGANRN